ncbi:MAG TPA: FHA domain-containing protein [Myxococcales bacterium]|nr:FHA domain-containing protein [Myxococcales bacterium]
MVKLEIRNLESSKSHLIDPGGAVLGREGGDAQIKLADQGVSKKHARIYAKRGTWYLEDLDSANGTYLEDERITSPVVLAPGAVFTMSRQQFEVVQIVTEEPEPTRNPRDAAVDDMDHAETNAMEQGELPDRLRAGKGKKPAGKSAADLRGRNQRIEEEEPIPTDHSTSARARDDASDDAPPPRGGRGKGADAGRGVQSAARSQGEDADVPAPSLAYFASAIPRAVAYYMKSVPLMAVNPLGTIRKGIAEQPLPALSNVELIAYAFPALLFSALVTAVCQAILAIRTHTFSVLMLFPIGPLIGAAVGAVVGGLILHPVLTWLVDKLEGQSDARSRSNMFVMQMTATALLAIPGGLVILFGLIPFSIAGLVPLLISVVASLVTVFLLFSWFRYFGVVQWFEYVILGLGALLVLQAAYGLVMTTIATVRGGFVVASAATPAGGPTEPVAGEPPEVTEARRKAAELAANAGSATAPSNPAAVGPSNPTAPASDPPPPSTSPGSGAANPPAATTSTTTASATPGAANPTAPAADPPPPAAANPPPPPPPEVTRPANGKKPSFPEYHSMLVSVKKAIDDDPTLLKRKEVLALYRELLEKTKTTEEKSRPVERGPAAPVLNAKLREVEVYDATWKTVMDLHRQLFR